MLKKVDMCLRILMGLGRFLMIRGVRVGCLSWWALSSGLDDIKKKVELGEIMVIRFENIKWMGRAWLKA